MNTTPTSLVTGGAGFMGSHVARHLLREGHRVVVLDDLSGGFEENVPRDSLFVRGSILDHSLIDRLFAEHQFTYVYHLAAYAAEGLSHFIKRFNYQNNLLGSVNLINASLNHRVECFTFTSSIAVYGEAQPPMTEETTPRPADPYGIAKLAVEMELASSNAMFGLDYIVFRPHNVYGPQQNIADPYRNVVGIFMNQLLHGEPMTVFGDGSQTRAFTHIDDVAPLIARAVSIPEARNSVFNVGADDPCTVTGLAEIVARAMDCECRIRHLDERHEVRHAFSDHRKLERVFGSTARTSLEHGVLEMAKWVKEYGARTSRGFEDIEVARNLPPSWRQRLTASAPAGRREPSDVRC